MQTKARTLQSIGKDSPQRTFTNRCFKGNKHTQTDEAGGRRPKNDFLKKIFRPIPATRFNPLFNADNYDFLYQSGANYLKLLGSSFDLTPQAKDFTGLFQYFQNLLPEGQHLLLAEENEKLFFKVLFGGDFLVGEVFFIPINILNRTEGIFRDILLTFFGHFHHAHRFPQKKDLYEYKMIVDSYFEEWCECDDDQKLRDFLEAYRNGYINDTFSLIYQKPNRTVAELKELINRYIPKNENEKRLIASIRQGINILLMNKNIFEYAHRPGENDDNFFDVDDDYIIEAERLIRFVYSDSDYVTESYLESLNNEMADSACEYFPRKSIILTPVTDCLLEVDFVECFFSWLSEFINELYEYETRM